ncbi:serine/threonine-protein kinase [Kitasatospora sp. NPDC127111]|uniref:serine/threonine-protein kinase n=1 Tax=Kitasatospora sp. NPDC127111 TaxID=3345363 RepID=UPI00362F83D6
MSTQDGPGPPPGGAGSREPRLLGGRYVLGALLGRGGMGTVWRAHDQLLDRDVAVKEVSVGGPPGEEVTVLYTRMQREARAAARVKHPGIVTVHDVLEQDGRPWIVMELVDGRSLADAIAADGPLSPREAARVGAQVLAALERAHEAGVVHRDVKPANVLLEEGGRVVLTDFGIAAFEGSTRVTRVGDVVGSPDYLAPEQITGERPPGPASDLWSLGATLYTAVEGRPPFGRPTAGSTLHAVVADPLPEPRRAGPLGPVLDALLRKDPDARPTDDQARRLLAAVAAGSVAATAVPATASHPPTAVPAATVGGEPAPRPTETVPVVAPTRPTEVPVAPAATVRAAGAGGGSDRAAGDGGRRRRAAALAVVAVLVLLLSGGGLATALYRGGEATTAPATTTAPSTQPSTPAPSTPTQPPTTPPATPPTTPTQPPTTQAPVTPTQPPTTPPAPVTPTQPPTTPPAPATPTQPPTTQAPVTPTQPPATPVPPGYQLITDPAGFTVAVPIGWTRSTTGNEVDYTPDDGTHLLRVNLNAKVSQSSESHFLQLEASVAGTSTDYRRITLEPNTFLGFPGALWEFSWDAGQYGLRHAIDQSFIDANGDERLIYVGCPEQDWPACRQVFDTALGTFSLS